MRYKSIKGRRHYVYKNEEEFKDVHPEGSIVQDWRGGVEGDWVYADDGGIVQLLRVSKAIKHPNDRKNYKYAKGWCRTIVGTFLNTDKTIMDTDFDSHKNRYTFSKTIGNKKNTRVRKSPTKKEKIFATNVVVGMGPVKAYMDAYREEDENQAQKKAVILLKQDRVMKEIQKSVMDVAEEMGLDHSFVLNKLKHLANYSDDDNIILQSTKEIGKIIGTSGTTVKQRESGIVGLFQGFTPEQLQTANRKEISNGQKINDGEVNEDEGTTSGDGASVSTTTGSNLDAPITS
jgi:hypothetical protein